MAMRVWKVGLVLAATLWLGSPDPAWAQRGRMGGGRAGGGGRIGGGNWGGGNWGGAHTGNWGGGTQGGFQGSRGAGLSQGAMRSATPRSGQFAGGQSTSQAHGSFAQRHNSAGAGLGRNTAGGTAAAGTAASGSGSARQNFAARHGQTGGVNANARTAGTAASSAGSRTVVAAPGGAVASGSNGTFVRVGGFAIGVGSNGGFYLRLGRPFYGYGYGLRPYAYGYYPYPYYAYPYYSYYPGTVAPAGYADSPTYGYATQTGYQNGDGTDPLVALPDDASSQPPAAGDVPELVETALADAGPARIPRRSSDLDLNSDFARQGEAAFKAGNYAKAARAWRHAALDDPQNGTLVMMLAQALFATSNYDEAAGATQQGMLLLPEDKWNVVVGHYQELYTKVGDYTTQLRSLEDARKAKPDDPALRFLLGYHYGYLGYPDRAVKELDKGLELAAKDELAQKLRDHFVAQTAAQVK